MKYSYVALYSTNQRHSKLIKYEDKEIDNDITKVRPPSYKLTSNNSILAYVSSIGMYDSGPK